MKIKGYGVRELLLALSASGWLRREACGSDEAWWRVSRVVAFSWMARAFMTNEMVQLIGIRYDGSTVPFGNATANRAGAIHADAALCRQRALPD